MSENNADDAIRISEVWLVRHGETEWSRDHRHTSFTDIALTDVGTKSAEQLKYKLQDTDFDLVLTSPRQRAWRTAGLAGFPDAEVEENLVEWHYGDYEGITTEEIRRTIPGWTVWTHGAPGGESADQVAVRMDGIVDRVRDNGGRTLIFAHGHALRALAARWIGYPVTEGRYFRLDTATISTLGYERETPVILRWNH